MRCLFRTIFFLYCICVLFFLPISGFPKILVYNENQNHFIYSLSVGMHYLVFTGSSILMGALISMNKEYGINYYQDIGGYLITTYGFLSAVTLFFVGGCIVKISEKYDSWGASLTEEYGGKKYLLYPIAEFGLTSLYLMECLFIYTEY